MPANGHDLPAGGSAAYAVCGLASVMKLIDTTKSTTDTNAQNFELAIFMRIFQPQLLYSIYQKPIAIAMLFINMAGSILPIYL
jgi:hypothetical protein